MSIEIDDEKFQQILDITIGDEPLDQREIRAVVQVVQLAASVDLDEDPAERALVHALTRQLCTLGGLDLHGIPPLSPVPTDDEERAALIAVLAQQLVTSAARDLAFALAYLVIIVDLELAPIEGDLLAQVQRALAIPSSRGDRLIAMIARIVTPGEALAPDLGIAAAEARSGSAGH